ASELAPDNALVHYNMGILLTEARRWQPAVDHLEKATSLDTNQANAWFSLGVAYSSWADEMHAQLQATLNVDGPVEKPPAGASPQAVNALRQKAVKAFEQFLKVAPGTDPGREQAESEIQRLQKPASQ